MNKVRLYLSRASGGSGTGGDESVPGPSLWRANDVDLGVVRSGSVS